MANTFASGRNSIATCDRCGAQFKLTELKKEVKKLKTYNLLVCTSCWDPDHPQMQLGMFPVNDPQAVREPRKDTSYLTSGDKHGGSRVFQWGWNPVGGASQFTAALTPNNLVLQSSVGIVTVSTA